MSETGPLADTEQPQTWHYGLIARWWAEFNVAKPEELNFFRELVARHGQPVLDLGCGTGRLLVPLAKEGLDVDGCDISNDMIALCSEKAQSDGLAPGLYVQPMHALDLPRTYGTIYICGSFGLAGRRNQNREALANCYRHLEPGGALAFDHEVPYGNARSWQYWLSGKRETLPAPVAAFGNAQAGSGWLGNRASVEAGSSRFRSSSP